MHSNPTKMQSPLPDDPEGAKAMTISLRDSVELISGPCQLDASVEEVFALMVGVACRRSSDRLEDELESLTAVVGFGGLLTGACVLRCSGTAARAIAGRMTAMDFAAIDDTVKDAIGEICNMLAGAWKSKVPELAAHCDLSVPAVITGRDYQLRVQAPEFTVHRGYRFDDAGFEVTILCDGLR